MGDTVGQEPQERAGIASRGLATGRHHYFTERLSVQRAAERRQSECGILLLGAAERSDWRKSDSVTSRRGSMVQYGRFFAERRRVWLIGQRPADGPHSPYHGSV